MAWTVTNTRRCTSLLPFPRHDKGRTATTRRCSSTPFRRCRSIACHLDGTQAHGARVGQEDARPEWRPTRRGMARTVSRTSVSMGLHRRYEPGRCWACGDRPRVVVDPAVDWPPRALGRPGGRLAATGAGAVGARPRYRSRGVRWGLGGAAQVCVGSTDRPAANMCRMPARPQSGAVKGGVCGSIGPASGGRSRHRVAAAATRPRP
jgi:predicted CxxxxCH...CXXCH cytochrome family protein